MLTLRRGKTRGHFVTLIEIREDLIRINPGNSLKRNNKFIYSRFALERTFVPMFL